MLVFVKPQVIIITDLMEITNIECYNFNEN